MKLQLLKNLGGCLENGTSFPGSPITQSLMKSSVLACHPANHPRGRAKNQRGKKT